VTTSFLRGGMTVVQRIRALLWRVRNRLLLTYALVGVVPVVLIGILLLFSAKIS